MNKHRAIHGLAIVSLAAVAVMNITGSMRQIPGASFEMKLVPVFGFVLWSWLLWKIWRFPRKWGLRVGILLFLMIAIQSYYWWRGINDPRLDTLNLDRSLTNFIVLHELPIFIAGLCCALLSFYYPKDVPESPVESA